MKRVVIGGGTGFIGSHLSAHLRSAGYEVVVLNRNPKGDEVKWDGKTIGDWARYVDGAEAVINLSGSPVAVKWTDGAKKTILDSRIEPTHAIGKAIRMSAEKPKVWLNGSAIGIYGNRGDEELTEDSRPGSEKEFLVEVCVKWENAAREYEDTCVPISLLRTGLVMDREGGFFPMIIKVTKAFLGGNLGDGQQWMSWIHLDDHINACSYILENRLGGPFNLSAPNPVRNHELMEEMREDLHRPWAPPAPEFGLKIANMLGGPDPTILMDSTRAIPRRLEESGFKFKYETVDAALAEILARAK